MIPTSAASVAPRSELSSHGWTTTVVAAGTSLLPRSAARTSIQHGERSNRSLPVHGVIRHDALACKFVLIAGGNGEISGPFQPGSTPKSSPTRCDAAPIFGGVFAGGAQYLGNKPERFPGFDIVRQHRWDRGEGCFRIDQQHLVLFAHDCFELSQRHVAEPLRMRRTISKPRSSTAARPMPTYRSARMTASRNPPDAIRDFSSAIRLSRSS